jgi:effector-binding domain-containing protein
MTDSIGTRSARTPEIVDRPEQRAAVVAIRSSLADFPGRISEAFALTAQRIAESGASVAGPPFARYFEVGEEIQAEAGFPFHGTLQPTDRVMESALPGGRTVTTTHVGPYPEVGQAWERGFAWMAEHELTPTGPGWESYLTGPDEPGPLVTEIFWPID